MQSAALCSRVMLGGSSWGDAKCCCVHHFDALCCKVMRFSVTLSDVEYMTLQRAAHENARSLAGEAAVRLRASLNGSAGAALGAPVEEVTAGSNPARGARPRRPDAVVGGAAQASPGTSSPYAPKPAEKPKGSVSAIFDRMRADD